LTKKIKKNISSSKYISRFGHQNPGPGTGSGSKSALGSGSGSVIRKMLDPDPHKKMRIHNPEKKNDDRSELSCPD
jgi:hypothetical protein